MPKTDIVAEKIDNPATARDVVRVGIVGYGTVGRASAEILTSHAEEDQAAHGGVSIVVTRISASRRMLPNRA